ncbi:hybrid sensor histidine kinase/response regulator transcription factor [Mariniflexile maritimum]|uniref:hybrid sensor histidine kinase/response regulator transcription factor n=1 Tax=Mariniflexile maritimum TaxID=2682493 RepID=UPI0012F68CFD|nr:response regulator [Mariniflexile maritimum]
MFKANIFFILFFFWLNVFNANAQNAVYEIQSISVKEGLPNSNIFSILQDKNNFLWASTIGGLIRYDGYNIKNYDASFFNINEGSTLHLALDTKNRIWFCEDLAYATTLQSGVLDTETDSIIPIGKISKGLIKSGEVLSLNPSRIDKNVIFIADQKGRVYKYDGKFEQIFTVPDFKNRRIVCELDGKGNYWIAYDYDFVVRVNAQGKEIDSFKIEVPDFYVRNFMVQPSKLIVEGYNLRLRKDYVQIKNNTVQRLGEGVKNNYQLLYLDDEEQFFARNDTIFNGNPKLANGSEKVTVVGTIPNLRYNSAFRDRQGILWITSATGIHKIVSKKNPFTIFGENNSIRGIYVSDGKIWLGGYEGSKVYDLKSRKPTKVELPKYTFSSFVKDERKQFWMGTTVNYLFKYDIEKDEFKFYKKEPYNVLYLPFVNPVTRRVWLGMGSGLSYINSSDNLVVYSFSNDLSEAQVRQFLYTTEGIWLITNRGLFLMDVAKDAVVKSYTMADGLPTSNINHLYIDSDGIFWLATKTKGLIKWNRDANTFTTFSKEDGLSNNTIYAVYEDDYNNLWLPSNYGLMRFDKMSSETQIFTVENGIADNEFNTYAHFKDSDGTFYFGGINGVTAFHPKDFVENTSEANPIYLSELRILKKNAKEFENLDIKAIPKNPIQLSYDDQILEFEVSLLDYKYRANHQYAYKIEGYHNQWIYTRDNKISIFNFPYGNHTIRVKAKGDSDLWTDNELLIPINVDKPFYLKWQYIAIFFLFLMGCAYFYFKWRIRNLNRATVRLEAEVASRTQQIEADKQTIELQAEELKALDVAKGRFFANLTHEFRTPLTLIVGPLEQIIDNPPPSAILKRRATGILNNAKHILGLINQLLDLTKLESKQMPIELVNADIVAHTKELVNRFQSLANQNNQQLSFKSNEAEWPINFDSDKWDKIAYNLISNALKFTPKNGRIEVVLNRCEQNDKTAVELLVIDSGVGIDEKNKEAIFNRFYQVDLSSTRANDGTGIGLALVRELVELQGGTISVKSEINEGATFRVLLPISEDAVVTTYIPNRQNEFLIPAVKYEENLMPSEDETAEKLDILVVEDNEDIRDYIVQCLGQKAYNIATAKDGEEGLEKALSLIPDLIISDVMMPKKNGFELVEAIRNHISTSHIPIILLTAKTNIDSKLQGLKRGADDYLTKPFNPKELDVRVKNLIEIRQRLQNRYSQKEMGLDDAFEKEDAFILRLKEYILENLQQTDLNGDIIGQHFALSRIHLYRKLKALTNMSISEFVKDIRLEKGLELLSQKQLNISEIAYEIGFTSPSHFSRSFKEKYGKSPSQM